MSEIQFTEFLDLKNYRRSFIELFDTHDTGLQKKLIEASKDINLESIRIHKYVTHNGTIGKVIFARFLDSIGLDEQTRIKELNISNIKDIVNFIENL